MQSNSEYSLTKKLIETRHLRESERAALPNGSANKSLIHKMILEVLQSHGWFPTQIRPDDIWLGGLIELQENSCLIHWQYEAGVSQRGTTIESFSSAGQAITKFINEEFGDEIDGVPIT